MMATRCPSGDPYPFRVARISHVELTHRHFDYPPVATYDPEACFKVGQHTEVLAPEPLRSRVAGGNVGLHSTRNTRGGSFVSGPTVCRSATRMSGSWNHRRVGLGFRLARTGRLSGL